MSEKEIRIAVLSDSHGWLRRCVIREVQDCSHILHAGDIIRESDLDELALYGQLYAVRGNWPCTGSCMRSGETTTGGCRAFGIWRGSCGSGSAG